MYLNWRRVQTLSREYSPETLLEFLKTESERLNEIKTEFNAHLSGRDFYHTVYRGY